MNNNAKASYRVEIDEVRVGGHRSIGENTIAMEKEIERELKRVIPGVDSNAIKLKSVDVWRKDKRDGEFSGNDSDNDSQHEYRWVTQQVVDNTV